MIVVITAVIIGCIYWIYWVVKVSRIDRMTSGIVGLPTLPIIGNALMFIGNTEKILKNIEYCANIGLKNNGICKVWLGPKLYVAIGDPEDAQLILDNFLDKDGVYRFLQPWLGHGLFVAPLGLWKTQRRQLVPLFYNRIIEDYIEVIGVQADVLLQKLSSHSDGDEFDVLKYITACTLDIVFETAMGERMDVQHSPNTPYLRARNTVMTILNMRIFKVWLQPDFLFNLTPYAKQQKENIDLTHKFTDEVVKKRRKHYEESQCSTMSTGNTKSDGKLQAILDLLFGRGNDFTDQQLREHIDSITIAGNDTTALVIAYTIVLLGIHQDAQDKVYKEQQEIMGDSKGGATKDDLQRMHYLERVIKESMRLYTVVPIVARNIDKDVQLPHSGVILPAGTGAVVGAFAMHRSELIWGADANDFCPDRFLPENSLTRHPASFLPFSYGPRNCIGRNFGMIIIKSIVSSVIRSYKIEANDIGPLKIEILLFPINGHQIKIKKR